MVDLVTCSHHGCGKRFEPTVHHHRFCSPLCQRESKKPAPAGRICVVCGRLHYTRSQRKLACSEECSKALHLKRKKARIEARREPGALICRAPGCVNLIERRYGAIYCGNKCKQRAHYWKTKKEE